MSESSVRSSDGLTRLLRPRTVAVVGMRDGAPFVPFFLPTLDSDVEIVFVNPKYDTVMGRRTVSTLSDIEGPIDAVYCVTSAKVAVQIVEEAATLDVGGFVLVSSGYAEIGPAGAQLQDRLSAAAKSASMAIVGPNGLGYVNVPDGVALTIAGNHKRRPGGISVVSQSGALLSGVAMAAWDRPAVGLNFIISAGNEAVTDLADYVDFLVDDPQTSAIGLVIEKIRRPDAFFAAARRALDAGKPIVALKLARSERTRAMAASHTGALTGDSWVYDVAFRQLGIGIARDADELVDRLAVLEQLDPKFQNPVDNIAILTSTGGYASLAMDLAVAEKVHVPALEEFTAWIEELIPGVHVPNPLDTTPTGLAHWEQILERYASSDQVDAVVFVHPLSDEDDGATGRRLLQQFADTAASVGKPFAVSNCAGNVGDWAAEIIDASPATASGRGPRAMLQGLRTLGDFARARRDRADSDVAGNIVPAPDGATVPAPEGEMLTFAAAMKLLSSAGIPTAPYLLVQEGAVPQLPPFSGPFVVKLADVGHRTEHGAVELGVDPADLTAAVERMRDIATRDLLSPVVAIQPMISVAGEAFLGIQNTELGPMVVFGLGGVFVELLDRVGGRMAPITIVQARELIAEFDDVKIMHGFRGKPGWNLDRLAEIIVAAGALAAGSAHWLESVDVNPLVVTDEGLVAVDALCLVRP